MKDRIKKEARRSIPFLANSSQDASDALSRKASKLLTISLSTRVLERSAKRAGKRASANAFRIAGYVVKAKEGWIVKEDLDGNITRISKIEKITLPIRFD